MKNILNVIVDILTLLAVCIAAIGHVLPWFNQNRFGVPGLVVIDLGNFQIWHSSRSGIALGVLAFLVFMSLLFNWGPTMRRLINVAMFVSAFIALLFQLLVFSNYPNLRQGFDRPLIINQADDGFFLAMVPTCFAVFFCLIRMLWTMPPTRRPPSPADLDKKPGLETPPIQHA